MAAGRRRRGLDRHPDVRLVHRLLLRGRQPDDGRTPDDGGTRTQMNQLLKEIRHNPLLWLLVFVPVVFAAAEAQARSAHAAVRAVRAGHRAAGGAAESRHRIGGGQDGRCGRRPAQRHAGKPDRTGHRARRLARRAIHAGEGVHRRRDCHQHAVHAGRVVSARRAQVPRAGIQPGQRPRCRRACSSWPRSRC